jgi:cell division protein FtsB
MSFEEIKDKSFELLARLPFSKLKEVLKILLNYIEDLRVENEKSKDENQKLKDEINRLKGEKCKPDIKPSTEPDNSDKGKKGNDSDSSDKRNGKSTKKDKIKITRQRHLPIDKSTLPSDAEYKGTRSVIVQDIKIEVDNIEFVIERYYSPSQNKVFESKLPPEYKGREYGPGIRAFVLTMHYQARIPQKLMHTILTGIGVIISEGQIGEILLSRHNEPFHQEREAARCAGILKNSYQQIDDTGARLNGENIYTIVTCNDDFCSFTTSEKKDRLSALKALSGLSELKYIINDIAITYINNKVSRKVLVQELESLKSNRIYSQEEFNNEILNASFIVGQIDAWKKYVEEGCAIGAYRENFLGPGSDILICDDAPQFKGILEYLGLCWVHEERHYDKLLPNHSHFQKELDNFLDNFWNYYDELKKYKENPSQEKKDELSLKFDKLFSADTDYFALNRIIKKTAKKKEYLLLVLDHPEIPLHNNTSELDIREKVVQRKIRNCFRSIRGAKASDTFLSLMAICRKQGISFWDYVRDRVYNLHKIPSLAEIIKNRQLTFDSS